MKRDASSPAFALSSVTIVCTDLGRARDFYCGVLGATPLPCGDGYGCPWFKLGSHRFSLMPNATAAATPRLDRPGALLWLEVEDLAKAHAYLSGRGVMILEPPEGSCLLIADPDGAPIEVWERGGADGSRSGA